MFTNYIITALRSMRHNKGATLISVAGLTIGVSCALFIFLYVQYELSRDNFHSNRYDIYRVLIEGQPNQEGQSKTHQAAIVHDFIPKMIQAFPEGKRAVRLSPQTVTLTRNGIKTEENKFFFTEPTLFDVFDFDIRQGNAKSALSAEHSILISGDMAHKYFGKQDPIGQKLDVTVFNRRTIVLTVTGVLKDIPQNSSLSIDFLASVDFDTLKEMLPDWMPLYTYSYIKFDWIQSTEIIGPNDYRYWRRTPTLVTMVDTFKKELLRFKLPDLFSDNYFRNWHFTVEPLKPSLFATPKSFVSPNSDFSRSIENQSSMLVLFLSGMGVLILFVSCINVINLSVARSTGRAREIAVRKVLGADQGQLFLQFLTESLFLSVVSLVLAASLVELTLPVFNRMVHQELVVDYLRNGGYYIAMGIIVILTGFISGLYPAVFLSSFQPVHTLQGEDLLFSKNLRKILMIFQITVSVCISIAALQSAKEIRKLHEKPLGFNSDRIIFFKLDVPLPDKTYNRFKKELIDLPGVHMVTSSGLAAFKHGTPAVRIFTCPQTGVSSQAMVIPVDTDFLNFYDIPIIQGKNLQPDTNGDGRFIVINAAAQNMFKLYRKAGETDLKENGMTSRVLGICQDFYYLYPLKEILPLVLVPANDVYGVPRAYISVKLDRGNHDASTIGLIEKKVQHFFPQHPFEYRWLHREIEKIHWEKNDAWKNVSSFSAWISGFLACLGLIGFAGYEIDRKTKEIGIRKALGAPRLEIAGLFILRFIRLTIIANVIAWPASYVLILWVFGAINYPYNIEFDRSIFLSVTILTLFIAFFTVSFQTFKAASLDPQHALRDE